MRRTGSSLLAVLLATATVPALAQTAQTAPPLPNAPEDCFAQLAATRSDTLGLPVHAVPTPDGRSVLFLRSGPRDTTLHLFLSLIHI